ncbi:MULTISPECIES: site-specific integrase [unclassified Enterobacter]|uniref:tyrosine-type recombinase/integrase n=1 Tax=unclassified Enterobacter TaxID=2608935 RepID=UPI0021489C67|nr:MULTISPECIES: site-specific integrase [unclassified Enterobacter]HEO9144900.1 tyrosine-type recombinase/integrase [Enterobacter asburiae]MCR1301640.1 tyrosine-type recombinase/integrase [Enterobacter sp. FL1277]MCR1306195.1 tyrosine-type recombinase/integrase [Enterobacter sp. BT1271]MCR1313114.1 tyrosine-type recombinase/integrase [Enterobacter sp. BT855]MCR1322798.1 tyrosine-type recombinase/integrase [Enterobacter sp. BT1268]
MTDKPAGKPLSSKAVEMMKPGDKNKADTGENRGLRVTCGASGIKTFFYRYTSPVTNKLSQVKIGSFPQTSLAMARMKLQELKLIRNEGRCPASELKDEKQRLLEESQKPKAPVLTVEGLVELYLTERIEDRKTKDGRIIPGARKPKGQAEVRRTLYGDAVKTLGTRNAAEITRQDVINLINGIVARGANVQAGNVLRELSLAYEFAIGLGRFDDSFANPALLAKSSLRQTRIKLTNGRGTRVLSEDELAKFLKWLPGSAYTPTIKNVLRLTLWTGCRTGEVCNMAWKDVDLEKGTIHLRETKTEIERYVQLSDQAIDFLKVLRLTSDKYLFPSQATKKPIQQKYLTENSWRLRESGQMLDMPHWTPHDLRRTVRTGLSRLQCPNEVAEAVLGHTRGGVEGIYNLYKYDAECRKWLQVWADYLDGLIK